MRGLLALLFLIQLQPLPVRTVADCLMQSGYSQTVDASEVTAIRGTDAAEWEAVLAGGRTIGRAYETTDSGARLVLFYALGGRVYAFVAKHPDDPGYGTGGVVHGDCMLRLVDGA